MRLPGKEVSGRNHYEQARTIRFPLAFARELLPESLVFRWLLQGFRVEAFHQDPGGSFGEELLRARKVSFPVGFCKGFAPKRSIRIPGRAVPLGSDRTLPRVLLRSPPNLTLAFAYFLQRGIPTLRRRNPVSQKGRKSQWQNKAFWWANFKTLNGSLKRAPVSIRRPL